jgi:peptide/nickel transport system substrate-binding protein
VVTSGGDRGFRISGSWAALVSLALVALVLGGCGSEASIGGDTPPGAADAKPARGDTLIEASFSNVSGLIPNITSDSASHRVGNHLYTGLITRDGELNIIPDLAESWEFSRDCLHLTFKLRQNVKWHDGHPFTADDVLFTYRTMIDPRTPTAYRDDFLAVRDISAPDPYTVRVDYAQPQAKALPSWEFWILPRHLLEPWAQQGKLREAPQNRTAPVGTGAYRFKEWKPGEKLVLTANRDFYMGPPYISRLVVRIIPSQATIFLELKARGIDYTETLTALQYTRQTNYPAFRKAYHKFSYPANGYTYLGFNLRDPRFRDHRVRLAFAYAINKRELIEGVRQGLAREASGPFKPGTWAFNPNVKPIPYDPARAKLLLAQAGWVDRDGDGLVDKDGHRFKFEILTNQGNEERRKAAEIIQAALKDIGVVVEIRVIEWASLLKEYIKKRRFEALVLGWGIGSDPDQSAVWHSSQTGPDQLNHIGYSNPVVDELLERGKASCNEAERAPYYHRLHEVLAEDQPLVFLYWGQTLPVVASRVYGIVPTTNGIIYNFEKWFVPKELQRYTAG